jgi:hypothetical protein
MQRSQAAALSVVFIAMLMLLWGKHCRADVLVDGKVYPVTADRIIVERQLQCTYGQWRSETLPNGSTIIIRDKVCTNEKR